MIEDRKLIYAASLSMGPWPDADIFGSDAVRILRDMDKKGGYCVVCGDFTHTTICWRPIIYSDYNKAQVFFHYVCISHCFSEWDTTVSRLCMLANLAPGEPFPVYFILCDK